MLTTDLRGKIKGREVQLFLQEMLSITYSHITLKRFVTFNFHKPDESQNLKPCQFALCSCIFPQEHLIFSVAVYSFDIFDLRRLSKGSEVNTSLEEKVIIH